MSLGFYSFVKLTEFIFTSNRLKLPTLVEWWTKLILNSGFHKWSPGLHNVRQMRFRFQITSIRSLWISFSPKVLVKIVSTSLNFFSSPFHRKSTQPKPKNYPEYWLRFYGHLVELLVISWSNGTLEAVVNKPVVTTTWFFFCCFTQVRVDMCRAILEN